MIDIKQKLNSAFKKLKETDWKKFIGTKAFITIGCLVLVCASIVIGTLAGGNGAEVEAGAENSGTAKLLGNALLVDAGVSRAASEATESASSADAAAAEGDFFAMAMINRSQTRDSALEVLRAIAESPDSMPDAKESALHSIAGIADDMAAETNIETLVRAKGIADCVAVISGKTCSVIVNTSALRPEEVTQIADIVREQAGIPIENITVVEAKRQ